MGWVIGFIVVFVIVVAISRSKGKPKRGKKKKRGARDLPARASQGQGFTGSVTKGRCRTFARLGLRVSWAIGLAS